MGVILKNDSRHPESQKVQVVVEKSEKPIEIKADKEIITPKRNEQKTN